MERTDRQTKLSQTERERAGEKGETERERGRKRERVRAPKAGTTVDT